MPKRFNQLITRPMFGCLTVMIQPISQLIGLFLGNLTVIQDGGTKRDQLSFRTRNHSRGE